MAAEAAGFHACRPRCHRCEQLKHLFTPSLIAARVNEAGRNAAADGGVYLGDSVSFRAFSFSGFGVKAE